MIPKIKILVSLIVLPGLTCAQPLVQLAALSQQVVNYGTPSRQAHDLSDILNKSAIDEELLTRGLLTKGLLTEDLLDAGIRDRDKTASALEFKGGCQPTVDCLPTVLSSAEIFDYQIEATEHNSYLLDDSFSVQAPCVDYHHSDSNDVDPSKSALGGSTTEPNFVKKPLQLLNLLAGEDVTLYEAADMLRISVHTANKYVANIKSEFGVLTLPAAVLHATKEGLI